MTPTRGLFLPHILLYQNLLEIPFVIRKIDEEHQELAEQERGSDSSWRHSVSEDVRITNHGAIRVSVQAFSLPQTHGVSVNFSFYVSWKCNGCYVCSCYFEIVGKLKGSKHLIVGSKFYLTTLGSFRKKFQKLKYFTF